MTKTKQTLGLSGMLLLISAPYLHAYTAAQPDGKVLSATAPTIDKDTGGSVLDAASPYQRYEGNVSAAMKAHTHKVVAAVWQAEWNQERAHSCQPGQGKSGASKAQSGANSKSACAASCNADSNCAGFDFTTQSKNDACRLYHSTNSPRLSNGGGDHRQWCVWAASEKSFQGWNLGASEFDPTLCCDEFKSSSLVNRGDACKAVEPTTRGTYCIVSAGLATGTADSKARDVVNAKCPMINRAAPGFDSDSGTYDMQYTATKSDGDIAMLSTGMALHTVAVLGAGGDIEDINIVLNGGQALKDKENGFFSMDPVRNLFKTGSDPKAMSNVADDAMSNMASVLSKKKLYGKITAAINLATSAITMLGPMASIAGPVIDLIFSLTGMGSDPLQQTAEWIEEVRKDVAACIEGVELLIDEKMMKSTTWELKTSGAQAHDAFKRIVTSFSSHLLVRESDMGVLRGAMWDFLARFSALDVSSTFTEETAIARKDLILEVLPYMQQLTLSYKTALALAVNSAYLQNGVPKTCASGALMDFALDSGADKPETGDVLAGHATMCSYMEYELHASGIKPYVFDPSFYRDNTFVERSASSSLSAKGTPSVGERAWTSTQASRHTLNASAEHRVFSAARGRRGKLLQQIDDCSGCPGNVVITQIQGEAKGKPWNQQSGKWKQNTREHYKPPEETYEAVNGGFGTQCTINCIENGVEGAPLCATPGNTGPCVCEVGAPAPHDDPKCRFVDKSIAEIQGYQLDLDDLHIDPYTMLEGYVSDWIMAMVKDHRKFTYEQMNGLDSCAEDVHLYDRVDTTTKYHPMYGSWEIEETTYAPFHDANAKEGWCKTAHPDYVGLRVAGAHGMMQIIRVWSYNKWLSENGLTSRAAELEEKSRYKQGAQFMCANSYSLHAKSKRYDNCDAYIASPYTTKANCRDGGKDKCIEVMRAVSNYVFYRPYLKYALASTMPVVVDLMGGKELKAMADLVKRSSCQKATAEDGHSAMVMNSEIARTACDMAPLLKAKGTDEEMLIPGCLKDNMGQCKTAAQKKEAHCQARTSDPTQSVGAVVCCHKDSVTGAITARRHKKGTSTCYKSLATYQEAKDICAADGAELCRTQDHVNQQCQAGCGRDYSIVWALVDSSSGFDIPDPAVRGWVLSETGASCRSACARIGSACDLETTLTLVGNQTGVEAVAASVGIVCEGAKNWAYKSGPGICTSGGCCNGDCVNRCVYGNHASITCDSVQSSYSRLCACNDRAQG